MSKWDKTEPNGRELINNGANRIRELKDALETAYGEEHDFTLGYHVFPYGNTVTGYEGRWRYNNTLKRIERYTGGAWGPITLAVDIIPSGTKTIFFQAAAPTGWTQDTTFGDDELLRVVGAGSISSGGSWGPSLVSYDSTHTHTILSTIQTFTHAFTLGSLVAGTYNTYNVPITSIDDHNYSHNHTDTSSGNHTHTVDSTWRPEYIDVIVATKD